MIEAFRSSQEQTIVTLVLSTAGTLFSSVCLIVNIAYRKHRLVQLLIPKAILMND